MANPVKGQEENRGIGIRNMKERVDGFGGNLEIRMQGGWRIYITVPKQAKGGPRFGYSV